MVLLENDTIRLRALEPDDIDVLYYWENDTSLWLYSNTKAPFSRYVLKKYLENSQFDIYQTNELRLMIEMKENQQAAGLIDLFEFDPYHKRVGLGILVHKDYRNKGLAFDSINLLVEYCFKCLGMHQVYCNISKSNAISLSLFKKAGFKICGEKKEWLFQPGKPWDDELILQKMEC